MSPAFPVHNSRNKGEIKTESVLTRLPCSLVLWHSLYWLNSWGRENTFGVGIAGMAINENMEVKNCLGIEKGSVSEDCKYDFVTKSGSNREGRIGWSGGMGFWWRLWGWLYAQVRLWKLRSSYHFVENSAHVVLKIELLFNILSIFEREAALKESVFWWVPYLTHKFLWSVYNLIINLSGLAWHMVWCIQYLWRGVKLWRTK